MLHSVAQGGRPERSPGQIHASFTSVGAALGPGEPIRSAESTGVQASGVVRGRKGPRSGFGLGQTALVLRMLDSTEDESTQQPRAWTTFVPLTSSRPGLRQGRTFGAENNRSLARPLACCDAYSRAGHRANIAPNTIGTVPCERLRGPVATCTCRPPRKF